VIYSGPDRRQNVWCWYIALGVDRNESNAHFVAVHAFKVDVERHELRAETHNLHGNDSSGVQFIQGLLLSLQKYAKREENQGTVTEQSIPVEVGRSGRLTPGLPSAKDRKGACMLGAAQTL
jgi:hypothetical protein